MFGPTQTLTLCQAQLSKVTTQLITPRSTHVSTRHEEIYVIDKELMRSTAGNAVASSGGIGHLLSKCIKTGIDTSLALLACSHL